MPKFAPAPSLTIKSTKILRLQRFLDRLRTLINRRPLVAPEPEARVEQDALLARAGDAVSLPTVDVAGVDAISVAEAPAPVEAKPVARLTDARTVEGSAHSADGATAPWLLLPAERSYRLYLPPHVVQNDGGEALPLVVMIHGCRESAEAFERGTRMNAIAEREGFAVLYPDQATFANIRRCWNWFEPNTAAGNGECAIILEMIDQAYGHVMLDRSRVCVAGMSSGGALASLLAYHHPDVFAAAAVHSGLPPMMPPSAAAAIAAMEKGVRVDAEMLAESYWNTHEVLPPPLIVLHGDADTSVTEKNATSLLQLWEKLIEAAPQTNPLVREAREFAATDTASAYSQIDELRDGRIVIRGVRIHGLGHAWSGGDAELPFNDANGPDASAMIWKFFERQRRVA